MGGLLARSLIEELNFQNIIGLITLGTPHHDSPAAIGNWVDTAKWVKDLLTPGANDLYWDNYDGEFESRAEFYIIEGIVSEIRVTSIKGIRPLMRKDL